MIFFLILLAFFFVAGLACVVQHVLDYFRDDPPAPEFVQSSHCRVKRGEAA